MAFDDSPIVDENSKTSQESILAVRSFFTKKAGFIAREIADDYGIDIEVELVLESSKASAWSFPIQIKSNAQATTVKHGGKQFITFSFLTSRLGYLCRRFPAYGIVVLYDEGRKSCFYDYVENIIKRVTDQRDNEEWKRQDNVNINIPIDQLLSEAEINKISGKIKRRFENCSVLISEHGNKFDIPSLFTAQKDPSDFDSPWKIIKFIENYGIALFNKQDYLLVDFLLSKLTFSQINQSSKLLFIAALTYEGMGKYIDAEYFVNKCLQQTSEYSAEEKIFLKYLKSEIECAFGNLSSQEYESGMQYVFDHLEEGELRLCVKARLLHLKICKTNIDKEGLEKILLEIGEIVDSVDKTTLSAVMKYHYKVYLATDMFFILANLLTRLAGEIKIREIIYRHVSLKERIDAAHILLPILKVASEIYQTALDFATKGNDNLLKGYIYYGHGLVSFLIDSNLLLLNKASSGLKEVSSIYKMVVVAYEYFVKAGLMRNAYKAISVAYDINKTCQLFFKLNITGTNEEKLLSIMRKMEADLGVPGYISDVENNYNKFVEIRNTNPETQWQSMSVDEKEKYVKDFIKIAGIPQDRKVNVMADMVFLSEAAKALEGSGFQVLQNLKHTESRETMYAFPLKYILECNKCGFRTPEGSTLDELLNHKKRYHPHICL
ncbi:MAG: DUF4365 domain-containing protein [Candidatus Omnitrophica bacterium]|nr:DUF4365 domain-containing protein [Candidatus Gracilibacteria bacterium]MDD5503792.1 DUF4365 domain-containing protein [Candidatus Omnitrophota bacterium]